MGMTSGLKGVSRPLFVIAGLAAAVTMTIGLDACQKKPGADAKGGKAVAATPGHASLVNYSVARDATAPVNVTGTGTISAWQEVPVGAETGGLTAVALLVDEGQSVTQGQPLLRMNDVLLQAQYKQAKASYDQANAAYQRAATLNKQGYLSTAGLEQAQAAMLTTQAAMETAQTQLSLATVRAPVAGIVTERKAVLGQIIQQGAELFKIVRDGRVELNMEVVDTDLHAIKPSMTATVSSDSTGPVTGTVRIVTPQVDPSTRLGYARISVPWSSGLRPGMFASGLIDVGNQSVLLVPQSAVVYNENSPGVYVPDASGKVHLRKVVLGGTQPDKSVIIKDGLLAGDKVITTGAGFLNDGDSVKLAAQAQATAGGE